MEKSLKNDSNSELYRRFLDGDDDSFTAIVNANKNALIRFIAAITGDVNDAEDIAIDTFAVLMSRQKSLDENVLFKTLLFAIGKNLAYKYLKKHREKPLSLDESQLDEIWAEAGNPSFEEDFLRLDDKAHLPVYMRRLKANYTSVLHLLFFEGLSYAEAGKVMGKTEGQIRGLVHRAKETLKNLYESGEWANAKR